MDLFEKNIEDFEVFELDSENKYDDHVYQSFLFLLNRLSKATTQNIKNVENLQSDISKQIEQSRAHIDSLLTEKHRLNDDNKLLISGIIQYADIIYAVITTLENAGQKEMISIFEPVLNANNNILEQMGIHRIPSLGTLAETKIHSVKASTPTQDPELDCIICSTIREGYRRGDKIIRPADVIIYKYEK